MTKCYGAQFPYLNEQMILECIPIMENEYMYYLTFMEGDESLKKMLTNTVSRITTGKLVLTHSELKRTRTVMVQQWKVLFVNCHQ